MSLDHLPEPADREWLLDALAELIAARGWERFVTAPILGPSPKYFPDPFAPDARGVHLVAQRLLRYAGIGDLSATVVTADLSESREGTAAFFQKIDGTECVFGLYVAHLGNPDVLVGAMCHEVAHAFRDRHRIALEDPAEDEPLTDLTAVYLGFGVLTSSIAAVYESKGDYNYTEWSHRSFGYLPPQAICFLLAAQAVSRNERAGSIASGLPANQAAFFRAGYKALGSDAAGLRRRLGVPEPAGWPPPADLATLTAPLSVALKDLRLDRDVSRSDAPSLETGGVVFRVRRHRAFRWMLIGICAGAFGGLSIPLTEEADVMSMIAILGLVGGLIGFLAGLVSTSDHCSHCESLLPPESMVCPGCAGTVRGRLRSRNERLDAEEALEEGRDYPGLYR